MSEQLKLKYEVVAIIKENLIKGLESFGIPVSEKPEDGGWVVMEGDQPAFVNLNNAVLFFLEDVERIGWQGHKHEYNNENENFDITDYWIEQQTWQIKTICKRTTEPITDESIPLTAEDVTGMLIGWFNRIGCMEFRKHNMANLFVQQKDVRSYKGKSDVSQWTTEFPLKIQVIKQFVTEIGTAEPKYAGAVQIKGYEEEDEGESDSGG